MVFVSQHLNFVNNLFFIDQVLADQYIHNSFNAKVVPVGHFLPPLRYLTDMNWKKRGPPADQALGVPIHPGRLAWAGLSKAFCKLQIRVQMFCFQSKGDDCEVDHVKV